MTDSYVSMNPLDGEKDKLGRVLRTNAHCLGINGLYLDIDVLHGMDPYDPEEADKVIRIVLGVLLSILPKPTMVLLSGRGLTFVYRYDHLLQGEEITLHDAVYRALIEKVQKLFRNFWKKANPFSESRLVYPSIFSIFGPSTT